MRNFFNDDPATYLEIRNFGFDAKNFILGPMELSVTEDVCYHQPGVWIKRKIFGEVGSFNDEMKYIFDVEMMIRILVKPRTILYLDEVTAFFRLREGSKTVSEKPLFKDEGHFMPVRIFENGDLIGLHLFQARTLLDRGWSLYVNSIYKRQHSFSVFTELVQHVLADPVHRLNRFSIGAAKYHLAGILGKLFGR